MYSNLYIPYIYKRTGRDDETRVKIKLKLTPTFNFREVYYSVPLYNGMIYSAEGIEALADTSNYDVQDYVRDIDESIVQEIPIDVKALISLPYLYLPLSKTKVHDKVYFTQDEAIKLLDSFDNINEYEIIKDPDTYNVELKLIATLSRKTITCPLTQRQMTMYTRDTFNKISYISAPGQSTEDYKQQIQQLEEYRQAEQSAKKAEELSKALALAKAESQSQLLNITANLSITEVKQLIELAQSYK